MPSPYRLPVGLCFRSVLSHCCDQLCLSRVKRLCDCPGHERRFHHWLPAHVLSVCELLSRITFADVSFFGAAENAQIAQQEQPGNGSGVGSGNGIARDTNAKAATGAHSEMFVALRGIAELVSHIRSNTRSNPNPSSVRSSSPPHGTGDRRQSISSSTSRPGVSLHMAM